MENNLSLWPFSLAGLTYYVIKQTLPKQITCFIGLLRVDPTLIKVEGSHVSLWFLGPFSNPHSRT